MVDMSLTVDTRNALIVSGVSILVGAFITRYNLLMVPVLAGFTLFTLSLCKYELTFSFGISAYVFYNLAIIHFGSFDGKPYQIIWSIAFISYFLKSFYHQERILKFDKIDIPLFALLAAYILSTVNSISPSASFRETIQFLYFILIFKIICSSIKSKKEVTRAFHLIIVFGMIFIVIGLLTNLIGRAPFPQLEVDMLGRKISLNTNTVILTKTLKSAGEETIKRVSCCFVGYVETADIACQILIILLALIGGKHLMAKKKSIFYLAILLGGILLLFTFSRAGISIFILSTMLLLFFRKQFKSILIFSFILILILMLYKPLSSRMKETSMEQSSTRGHMVLYLAAYKVFLQSPVLGIGPGAFKELSKTDFARNLLRKYHLWGWPDTHNMFLQCASETGILGLISLISLLIIYFYSLIKAIRIEEDGYYRDLLIGLTLANFCSVLMCQTMNGFMLETFWVMLAVSYTAASFAGSSHENARP